MTYMNQFFYIREKQTSFVSVYFDVHHRFAVNTLRIIIFFLTFCALQITWCLFRYVPIVVMTVLEKNIDCPKLQFGSVVTFPTADTPLLFAATMSLMKSSRASSAN